MQLPNIYSLLTNKTVQVTIFGLSCAVAGLWVGYSNRPEPEKIVVEKITIDEKAIHEAVEKAQREWTKQQKVKVITRTTEKPNGEKTTETVSETETTETKEDKTEKTVVDKKERKEDKETKTHIIPYTPQWSVGSSLYKSKDELVDGEKLSDVSFDIRVGRKIILDLWVEGSYRPETKEVGLGLRYEF